MPSMVNRSFPLGSTTPHFGGVRAGKKRKNLGKAREASFVVIGG